MSDALPPPVLSYDRAKHNRRAGAFMAFLFGLAVTPYFAYAAIMVGEGWILLMGGLLVERLTGFDVFTLFQNEDVGLIVISTAVIIALGLGLLITWLLYRRAAGRVLRLAGAVPVGREQEKDLCRLVENLCIGSGLPQPALYVIETPAANALTLGLGPDQASLVVTRGLLKLLERRELEGVIAHELSQIGNYETRRNTVLAAFLGTVWLPYRILSRLFTFLFRLNRLVGAGCLVLFLVRVGGSILIGLPIYLSLFREIPAMSAMAGQNPWSWYLWYILPVYCWFLVPILGLILQRAALRQRIFRSDADAALLTRNPEALARALEKLGAGRNAALPASQATAHLYVVDPQPRRSLWLSGILNVHPPLAERVRLLARMSPGASLEKLQEAAQAGVRFGAATGLPPEEPAALARLAVRPKSLLAHVPPWAKLVQEFTISEGETCLTELEIKASQYRGAWTLGLERWEVFGDPGWLGLTREYYLEAKGEIQGRAHQRGFLSATHVVRFGAQTYTLEKESVFLRQFTLRAGGRSLGAIYPEGPLTKNVVAELPAATPLPLRIFLISLALLWWGGRTAGTRR